MAIELTLPAKVGAGASAAAAGSLAIAGGAGAFSGSPTTQVEAEQNGEDSISNPETPLVNQDFSEGAKPQTTPELTKGPTEISKAKQDVKSEPSKPVKTIKQDATSSYSDREVGKVYAKYLISAKSTKEDGNQTWWNNKFDEFQKREDKDKEERESENPFNNLPTQGFSEELTSSSVSLNAKCNAIYKLTADIDALKKTKRTGDSYDEDEEEDKDYVSTWKDLWAYCSEFKLAPVLLKSPSVGDLPTGKTWGKKLEDKVLSGRSYDNKRFWTYLNNEFFKQKDESITDDYFKNFRQTGIGEIKDNNIPLKEKCEEVYKLSYEESVSANNPSENAILKYCSLEGK